ncbi:19282_t:CDS:2, partial [Racocetra persica]
LKVQQLWNYSTIPAHFYLAKRYLKSQRGCLWLADEQFVIMLATRIRNLVKVWLMDQPKPEKQDHFVDEIVYYHNRTWKIRLIQYRYRHPSEIMNLPPIPSGLRCLRIFIDLYYDNFGTFRNVYHSLGFVLFGAKFEDFIKPFISDMQQLQNDREEVYIRGGLGVVTADLPQENNLSEVKRHGANHGYRSCEAEGDELTENNYDIIRHSQYHHITDMQFFEIQSQENLTNKKRIATKYSQCLNKNILDQLYRYRHQQCSQDLYHAMAEKVKRLMECTLTLFNDERNAAFLKIWKSIELPKFWSKLPNPITYYKSFMMSDLLRLAMLMPHILRRFLRTQHIKESTLTNLWSTIKCKHQDQVIGEIIKCWVSLSFSVKQSFAITFPKDYLEMLSGVLKKEHDNLIKVFLESFFCLPNLHVNVHLIANTKNYGTLINTACGVKEAMHGLFKALVPHTNKKNIDLDLLRRRSLLRPLLSKWYIAEPSDPIDDLEFENNEANGNFYLRIVSKSV